MKFKLLIIFFIILIIAFVIYSITWITTAKKIKEAISNSPNLSFFFKENIEKKLSIKGYPFKFKIAIPASKFNLNSKTKLVFKEIYISSNIYNFKKLSMKSKNFSIYTYINNFPIELRSSDFKSYIFFNKQNKIYKIDQELDNSSLLFKIDGKDTNIKIIRINNLSYIQDNNLNININLSNIRLPSFLEETKNNFIHLDISISEISSLKFSNFHKNIQLKNKKILLNRFLLNNNIVNIESNGFLNSDDAMNLNGKLNLISDKPIEIINFLYGKNLINIIQFGALKLILNTLQDTATKKINLPINFKYNNLYLGPVFITSLDSIKNILF